MREGRSLVSYFVFFFWFSEIVLPLFWTLTARLVKSRGYGWRIGVCFAGHRFFAENRPVGMRDQTRAVGGTPLLRGETPAP